MINFGKLLLFAFILITQQACAQYSKQEIQQAKVTTLSYEQKLKTLPTLPKGYNFKGWNYVAARLIQDGVPEREVIKFYTHPKLPRFEPVTFSLKPKEGAGMYQGFLSKKNFALGRQFINENKRIFDRVTSKYQVPAEVIAAILLVESYYGKNTGKEVIAYRLSRLANISDPINLKQNLVRLKKDDRRVTWEQVVNRAQYLENTFLPEIIAAFDICKVNNIDPFDFLGSSAGAFGWAQFLPSSYLKYAVDFDGDGKRSLYNKADAIASVANYFQAHGWGKLPDHDVIWKYNKSEPYIKTVLGLAKGF